MAQLPSRFRTADVPEQHVQVLDHQDEPLAVPVCEVLEDAEAAVAERPVVLDLPQFLVGAVQVRAIVLARRPVGEAGQAFEPEFAGGRDLVAFLGKDDREEAYREAVVPTYFGRDP